MKPELVWLLWAVALTFVQMLVAVGGATLQVGLPALAGLVLIAVVTNKTNPTTLLGAQLFFWARLAYALVYIAGIPWLRTALWTVSVIGMILIFVQLL